MSENCVIPKQFGKFTTINKRKVKFALNGFRFYGHNLGYHALQQVFNTRF